MDHHVTCLIDPPFIIPVPSKTPSWNSLVAGDRCAWLRRAGLFEFVVHSASVATALQPERCPDSRLFGDGALALVAAVVRAALAGASGHPRPHGWRYCFAGRHFP